MNLYEEGTVFKLFAKTAELYPTRPFLNVLEETANIYGLQAGEIAYGVMLSRVKDKRNAYQAAGYGVGHRVGLLLENRPAFFEHWFALNALGVSVVPINPDLRLAELEYLIAHSEQCLAVVIADRQDELHRAGEPTPQNFTVVGPDDAPPPAPTRPVRPTGDERDIEAALLYTSGTTGLPKGCVLTNTYFMASGKFYCTVGGYCAISDKGERMLSPLPLFHMNAMAVSAVAMTMVGGCLTFLDRFHPRTWWDSVRKSEATIVHYLGVMPAMLMSAAESESDSQHKVRFGFGAGVDRQLHAPFEKRFGFPLIEAWGMTETGNANTIVASSDPRHVGENCFGKPRGNVEVLIADEAGKAVPVGQDGELMVRSLMPGNPKYGFFDHYLKNEKATSEAWTGGWFHTGDIVRQNEDGTLRFVDRKKNVIRRSGENIAAVEVESALGRSDLVVNVAVAATPDEVRGDEVFACIIRSEKATGQPGEIAETIVKWCLEQLAYYKAPGYIAFVDDLPLTSTNKLKRGAVGELVASLWQSGHYIDLRQLKKRSKR